MGATVELARFAAETRFEDLPPRVVERTKIHILDLLSAGHFGTTARWSRIVLDHVLEQGSKPECSVFGTDRRVSLPAAAYANAAAAGALELEHVGHSAHASGTVIPPALATAERDHRSGRDLLLAITLGYEVVSRIGDAQTRAVEDARGFHNPSANGPFSAAVAVGKLIGLDAAGIASAMGIAGSQSGGLVEYIYDGSMTKRLHLGLAARAGTESALLVARGFTGPHTILEGERGYLFAFSPSPKPELLTNGLGEEWRFTSTLIKAYPCHMTSQSLVAAVDRLRSERDIDPSAVTRIHVRAGSHARVLEDRYVSKDVRTHLQAQLSMPFLLSLALHRDLRVPGAFGEEVLDDPSVHRLMGRVTWEQVADDELPDGMEVIVEVDGAFHTLPAASFRGSPEDPADFADVEAKFRRFTGGLLATEDQDRVVALVRDLEGLEDAAELAAFVGR